jgi:hypothetical protein
MLRPAPLTLQSPQVRLEPLTADHVNGLEAAARDGELWKLRVTSVPAPPGKRPPTWPPRSRAAKRATCCPSP